MFIISITKWSISFSTQECVFQSLWNAALGYWSGKQGHQYRPPVTEDFWYAAGYWIHQNECRNKEAVYTGRDGAVFSDNHRRQRRAEMREGGGRISQIPFNGQEQLPGSSDALGTTIQPYGHVIQWYLSGEDAKYHTPHLLPYLLQQYGIFLFKALFIDDYCSLPYN